MTSRTLSILPILLLAACGEPEWTPADTGDVDDAVDTIRSELERDLDPETTTDDQDLVAQGINAFACDLFHQISANTAEDESLFFSPISLSTALSMTWAGARGDTEAQMAEVLHYDLSQELHHPAFNALSLELDGRERDGEGEDGYGVRLELINSLWGQVGYPFLASFLDVIAEHYGAGMQLLDFSSDPEGSRQTINAWVEEQTDGEIDELLEPGIIDSYTALVLVNAITYAAAWEYPFPEEATQDTGFQLLDGGEVTVPMMTLTEELAWADGDGYLSIELPYEGEEIAMLVIVPDEGRYREIEAGMDPVFLDQVVDELEVGPITLGLPRWSSETKVDAVEQLQDMGMVDAFEPDLADFTGMNGGAGPLWISHVIHQARVSVDEEGTEAVAASAVVMSWGAANPVIVDRPFLYLLRDKPTGAVLFMGRMMDPSVR
jgi:serpin B